MDDHALTRPDQLQLFEARGLESWTTKQATKQASADGGIDAVMVNRDPILGGSTIVQAKRYSRVVSVSHIRALIGLMEETRAGHAVLITTSWFSAGSQAKAEENGRIELIDGHRLKGLARESLGIDVLVKSSPWTAGPD